MVYSKYENIQEVRVLKKQCTGIIISILFIFAIFILPYGNNQDNNSYAAEEFKITTTVSYQGSSPENNKTVYITETGSKYHKKSCKYLRNSCIKTAFEKAVKNGYTPCSICY